MKIQTSLILVMLSSIFIPSSIGVTADLKPVGGITAFGGAEKGVDNASGIGGLEMLGLLPVGRNVGVQGGLNFTGGQGFRFGVNAGPVLNFPSGKVGLFVDYEHRAREDFNYVGLRGIGGYYFDRVDALLSYSQPVCCVKRSNDTKIAGINELQGILRFYPTSEIELNGGILVNSFAGPGHSENGGTGVGGSFGLSFKLFDPVVIQLIQGKIDNRERYRITSGIQLIFGSPLIDWTRSHISAPGVGGGSGTVKSTRKIVRGASGPSGPTGPTGPTGPSGPSGPVGPSGPTLIE